MRIGNADEPDTGGEPAPAPPRRDERARAAAYLDRWERQLTRLAVHGLDLTRRPPA